MAWVYDYVRPSPPRRIVSSLYLALISFTSEVLGRELWGSLENYDSLYGYFDFRGKTVLDVGADYGSTADFFISKGALHVVAIECDRYLYRSLARRSRSRQITPLRMCIENPDQFRSLITKYKPELAKVDCEGCEIALLGVDRQTLSSVKEWIIEVHTNLGLVKLLMKYEGIGYTIEHTVRTDQQAIVLFIKERESKCEEERRNKPCGHDKGSEHKG